MDIDIKRQRVLHFLVAFPLIVALGLVGCQGEPTDPHTSKPTNSSTSGSSNTPSVSSPSASPSASETSTPVVDGTYWPCDIDQLRGDLESLRRFTFIRWTPDGSRLIFNEGLWKPGIMMASADGSSIRTIIDVIRHPDVLPYGYHADISPDGSQLTYTTCQFATEVSDPVFTGEEWYHYEIATINLDGGKPKRLTDNRLLDHFPVWSPDGTRIAFVADPPRPNFYIRDSLWEVTRLYTMAEDGTDVLDVAPSLGGVTLSPPEWSPDGQHLSFVVEEEGEDYQRRRLLYTVAQDGSGLRMISETVTTASWSPNGRRLAFGRNDGEIHAIYTVDLDGTDERKLVDAPGVQQVSWSPNGGEVLFIAESAFVVDLDGSELTQVYSGVGRAAWSPDGTRIAIFDDRNGCVVSVARDGTDPKLVARKKSLGSSDSEYEYEFVAASPGIPGVFGDLSLCAS